MSVFGRLSSWSMLCVLGLMWLHTAVAQNRVIVLNDAFGDKPKVEHDFLADPEWIGIKKSDLCKVGRSCRRCPGPFTGHASLHA
jgi:hypothetical protein